MCNVVDTFYQDLYSEEDVHEDDQDWFLGAVQTTLDPEESNALDARINAAEISTVIRGSSGGTCPGDDGLTIELYKLAPDQLPAMLARLFDHLLDLDAMPAEFVKGMAVLLYKKGDAADVRNYCPITLLNADYKLMTKILSRRIKSIAPKLVGPSQFAFLNKLHVMDNMMCMQLAMDEMVMNEDHGCVVLVDSEKAYDRVNHSWI
jgi:hypothetical protein